VPVHFLRQDTGGHGEPPLRNIMKKTLIIGILISLETVPTGLGDTHDKTLIHRGRKRSYRVHLPPSYREGSPMALIIYYLLFIIFSSRFSLPFEVNLLIK